MSVNIFSNYEVKYKCDYNYRVGFGFKSDIVEWSKVMKIGELIELAYSLCKLDGFYNLLIKDSQIVVSLFNRTTCEDAVYTIEYKEVAEKK